MEFGGWGVAQVHDTVGSGGGSEPSRHSINGCGVRGQAAVLERMKSLYHGEWRRDLGPYCSSHSYQLECSSRLQPPHTMRHLAKPSLVATIWLTFRHAQKQRGGVLRGVGAGGVKWGEFVKYICACVNFCQLLGIFTRRHRRPRAARVPPPHRTGMSFVRRLWVLGAGGVCWHEQRLTSTCDGWNVGFFFFLLWVGVWWRNGDTYQIRGDEEHCVRFRIHREQHCFTFEHPSCWSKMSAAVLA